LSESSFDKFRHRNAVRDALAHTQPLSSGSDKKLKGAFLDSGVRDEHNKIGFGLSDREVSAEAWHEFLENGKLHPEECRPKIKAGFRESTFWASSADDCILVKDMAFPKQPQEKNEDMAQRVIEAYRNEVNGATPGQGELKAIARCVQRLAQVHLFWDGNARTNGFLVLNKLLLERGLSPAMIEDPNDFDIFPVEELVNSIQIGQQRFAETCKSRDTALASHSGSDSASPSF
jgi:prophage maintenance system killer protein